MRNFEQCSINMKGDIGQRNIYVDDTIIIEDEFSGSEDGHDQKFYQQLVTESIPNDSEVCESTITSEYNLPDYNIKSEDIEVKEEYIESDDSADREFYLQLINESLSENTQDCKSIITRECDSSNHINNDSEEELDVGSVADNSLAIPTCTIAEGIKTRLRVPRATRDPSTSSSSGDNTVQTKKKKSKHKDSDNTVQTKKKKSKHKDSEIKKYVRRVYAKDSLHYKLYAVNRLVRDEHNDKERQRRGNLRDGFEELRVLVPTVSNDQRASKVGILGHASTYCQHLRTEFQARQKLVLELCQHQKRLRRRLDKLRKAAVT